MASWLLEERARARRARERILFAKKQAGDIRVCLIYPNRYAVAMGNLGFQAVYEIFDRYPGVVCERAFLPDRDDASLVTTGDLRSFETRTRVQDFDLIAFSISFETDYWHVVRLLDLIGVPLSSGARAGRGPLIIAGGPAVFLNPEPLAEFIDVFLIGEAEEMLPEFLVVLSAQRRCAGTHGRSRGRGSDTEAAERAELLANCVRAVAGTYVPALYEPVYDGAVLAQLDYHGPGTCGVERRLIRDLNTFGTVTRVLSDEAVFGDMVLVEASRGCQWGCRFCAAGYMYRPLRTRGMAQLQESVRAGLAHRQTIGLVGAEMASLPGLDALSAMAADAGGRLSPSSLKADCVTPQLAAALARGRNRSVTVAPEAGSERLRRVINKNLCEGDIVRAADLLVGEGVQDLKLYFMVGLPTERTEDVMAIAELTAKIRHRLSGVERRRHRVANMLVSVNPFVPKPWTPFQWEPMERIAGLKEKFARLRHALSRVANVQLEAESPREAYFQTLLSRGDRRVGRVVRAIHEANGDWWAVIRAWRQDGMPGVPHPDEYVHRTYGDTERLPWDFINHHIEKSFLWIERRKALASRQTAPCDTATCTSCGAC